MDVYVLADPRDGRIRYVGLSKDLKRRLAAHRCPPGARNRFHNGRFCDWKDELLARGLSFDAFQIGVRLTLAEAQTMERGYIGAFREGGEPILNVHDGGAPGNNGLRSAETRARHRAANLGRKMSPEAIAKTVAVHLGRKRSPETCAKIAARAKGRIVSPETREKISRANLGRKQPPEAIAKTAAALRGRPKSLEHRMRLSAAKKGKPMSPECIAGAKRRWPAGSCHTPETLAKLSEAQRLRWQRNPMTAETKAKIGAGNRGKKRTPEHRAKMLAGNKAWCAAKHAEERGAE